MLGAHEVEKSGVEVETTKAIVMLDIVMELVEDEEEVVVVSELRCFVKSAIVGVWKWGLEESLKCWWVVLSTSTMKLERTDRGEQSDTTHRPKLRKQDTN